MILYFDTETTGLYPGKICQLSYIMQDKNGVTAKNFFFSVDYVEPSAQAVHGFSVERLEILSGGSTFAAHIDEIENDFERADLIVAHNIQFDIGFMQREFALEYRDFHYNNALCSMRFFTPVCKIENVKHKYKFTKLNELADYFEVYHYDVSRLVIELFGEDYIDYHNAAFDTATLYLSFIEAVKSVDIAREIFDKYL